MKLVHPNLEYHIEFKENIINTIIIENPKYLYSFIERLYAQINGEEGEFILSNEKNILKISKEIELITDIFSIDVNNKNILTKFYIYLKSLSIENEIFIKTSELKSEIAKYLEELTEDINYSLVYKFDPDIIGIFKLTELKFNFEHSTLLEMIINYISLNKEFCGTSVFTFLNLKCFLDNQELEDLYTYTKYEKINLLLIENINKKNISLGEKIIIIDNDLCEIF